MTKTLREIYRSGSSTRGEGRIALAGLVLGYMVLLMCLLMLVAAV